VVPQEQLVCDLSGTCLCERLETRAYRQTAPANASEIFECELGPTTKWLRLLECGSPVPPNASCFGLNQSGTSPDGFEYLETNFESRFLSDFGSWTARDRTFKFAEAATYKGNLLDALFTFTYLSPYNPGDADNRHVKMTSSNLDGGGVNRRYAGMSLCQPGNSACAGFHEMIVRVDFVLNSDNAVPAVIDAAVMSVRHANLGETIGLPRPTSNDPAGLAYALAQSTTLDAVNVTASFEGVPYTEWVFLNGTSERPQVEDSDELTQVEYRDFSYLYMYYSRVEGANEDIAIGMNPDPLIPQPDDVNCQPL